jgi:hypothetical protein
MLFKVTELYWDFSTDDGDQEPTRIPKTLLVKLDDNYDSVPPLNAVLSNERTYEDIIEDVINQISDTHGWCVNNCRITRVE